MEAGSAEPAEQVQGGIAKDGAEGPSHGVSMQLGVVSKLGTRVPLVAASTGAGSQALRCLPTQGKAHSSALEARLDPVLSPVVTKIEG